MSRYWTHAAMLLIGISLTVGFYEGRRLVYNTAEALSVASQLGSSDDTRRRQRDRAQPGDAATITAQADAEPARPKRRSGGKKRRSREKLSEEYPEDLATMRAMRQQRRIERLGGLARPLQNTDPILLSPRLDRADLLEEELELIEPIQEALLDTGLPEDEE
ncbi:MAG TPA: hypothetical protein ENK18_21085 [Deltaproteobacteria bacterium]|nr:hypothetical protein [Deltaproteobacteria bacterium]